MHSENVDRNRIQKTLPENSGICESWSRNLHRKQYTSSLREERGKKTTTTTKFTAVFLFVGVFDARFEG